MLTEKGGCFHKTFGISLETIKHSLSGMIDKKIRPQASDLLRESVTSFAQLIPTVYSMSSRAMTPDVPLIPSSTICRKNTGVAVNCFQLILICFALLVCTCSLTPNPTGRIGIFSSSKERSCWCLIYVSFCHSAK